MSLLEERIKRASKQRIAKPEIKAMPTSPDKMENGNGLKEISDQNEDDDEEQQGKMTADDEEEEEEEDLIPQVHVP